MAVRARLDQQDEYVNLQIFVDETRLRATDDPHLPGYTMGPWIWLYFDDAKIDEGVREFLGVELRYVAEMTEDDLAAIERFDPPHIDIPEAGLFDISVTDVLRRVRQAWTARRQLVTA